MLRKHRPYYYLLACIGIKGERSCRSSEIRISQHWHAYQAIFELFKCRLLFLLPTIWNILLTQYLEGLCSNGKSKELDELSVCFVGFDSLRISLYFFRWHNILRKVTSPLRKWHLIGFSFKPAVYEQTLTIGIGCVLHIHQTVCPGKAIECQIY